MKGYDICVHVTVFSEAELSAKDKELVEAAKKATDNSYSPYSHFRVGAAIRLVDGSIVTGSNQENASYSLALCAERTAIFQAQHNHPELAITDIAIAARNDNGFMKAPIPPCGACRQVMLEMEDRYQRPMRVMLYGADGIHTLETVRDLLPFQFVGDDMK